MTIRRIDNHFKTISLPSNVVRTEQGWHVPIYSEIPDDLFITYLAKDWELVAPESEILENRQAPELAKLLLKGCCR